MRMIFFLARASYLFSKTKVNNDNHIVAINYMCLSVFLDSWIVDYMCMCKRTSIEDILNSTTVATKCVRYVCR